MNCLHGSVALKCKTCRIARSRYLGSRFMRWRANPFARNALVSMMMKRKRKKHRRWRAIALLRFLMWKALLFPSLCCQAAKVYDPDSSPFFPSFFNRWFRWPRKEECTDSTSSPSLSVSLEIPIHLRTRTHTRTHTHTYTRINVRYTLQTVRASLGLQ